MIFFVYIIIDSSKSDKEAFLFTLRNPHNVYPSRYENKKEANYVIRCKPNYGPAFRDGEKKGSDICIGDHCNKEKSCWIDNDGTRGYECHPHYKSSLYVNTSGPEERNYFSASDYEVFTME